MAKTYLQLKTVLGKWYVSERIPAGTKGWRTVEPAQPKRSKSEMILAGPFDTRDLATNWNNLTKSMGYIWAKE